MEDQKSVEQSLNSSYADVFETSGVIIRDYEGSFSRGPMVANAVTYNLNKCKTKVIVPYYKLLSLIAWRPFGKGCDCAYWCVDLCNFIYTFFCFCVLLFWYYIRVKTCQGHLNLDASIIMPPIYTTPHHDDAASTTPSLIINSTVMDSSSSRSLPTTPNNSSSHHGTLEEDNICQHLIGTYVIPSLLHFLAFVIGFFHFRIQEHEGLYALMEKVYLQSSSPSQMTRSLRIFLVGGMLWLCLCLATSIFYFIAFGIEEGSKVHNDPYLMYAITVLIVLAALFSNCVYVAVILSYCGQCELLCYYISGVKERLEEKSTELKTAMQEVLDIKQHFSRLNGMLSLSMSCLVFDLFITVIITAIMLFNFKGMSRIIWVYRLTVFIQYGSVLIFLLYQSALLTSIGSRLRERALAIRVFGYQSHSQIEIDSFLNFLYKVNLEAEIFTIPVKPRYLWGFLIVSVQTLIIAFQTGLIENPSKWL